jgi:hypothetical protein
LPSFIITYTAPPTPPSAPDSVIAATTVREASTPPYSAAGGWSPLVRTS